MYDDLLNGNYHNVNQASYDNSLCDETASAIYDNLVDINSCDIHDFDDYKSSYNDIDKVVTSANTNPTSNEIKVAEPLSEALDNLLDDYGNYNATNNQNEKKNAFNDFLHDMNIITDYKDDYKNQNYSPSALLDL